MEEKREGGKDPNQYLLNTAWFIFTDILYPHKQPGKVGILGWKSIIFLL